MRRLVLPLLLTTALAATPGVAAARKVTIAPPGNSAVSQYSESIPTAAGNVPANSVPGGGSGGGEANSPAVPRAVQKALAAQGPDGQGALSLAERTAPTAPTHPRPRQVHRPPAHSTPTAARQPAAEGGPSALGSIAGALTDSSGGMGVLFPALLLLTFLGAATLGLLRRRRAD